MPELELQAFGLSNVALRSAKQQKYNSKQTFTFFDFIEYNQTQELIIEHQKGKIIDEEMLCNVFRKRISEIAKLLEEAKQRNGFLGKLWHKTKNFTKIGNSSDKVKLIQEKELKLIKNRKIKDSFKELVGVDFSTENVRKFLNGELKTNSEQALDEYIKGQIQACDVMADILAGISSLGIYSLAVLTSPFSSGGSIALGVTLAGASSAAIKSGIKYADARSANRDYTSKNLKDDIITGGFSGIIAPITGGIGGAIGKGAASKLGVLAIEQFPKSTAQNALKKTLLNPTGYEYMGGNLFSRTLSYGTECAVDGALSGALDNSFREAYLYNGSVNEISQAALDGLIGGLVFSPIIGGGVKAVGEILPKPIRYYISDITIRKNLTSKKIITADDVKQLFPNGKLEENEFTREVDRIISEIADKRKKEPDYKVIDLKSELRQKDYETITELINIDKEKYLETWFGYSETDNIPNLQKLAMFAKVVQFTHQQKDFLMFDKKQWDIVVKGITAKPQDWIYPILRYKLDSTEINKALDSGNGSKEIKNIIKTIKAYLSLYKTKEDIVVYRGEGSYAVLNASGDKSLIGKVVDFTEKINTGKATEKEIEDFVERNFLTKKIYQKRFISTGMTKEAVLPYQKAIAWEEIIVPKGTKGAFIEPFCVERAKEAEFLVINGMNLLIKDVQYKKHNGKMKWVFKGKIVPK